MEKAKARVASKMMKELVCGTINAAAASTATTENILICARLMPEQPGRPHRKDECHRCVQREVRELWKKRLAEIVGKAHEECADRRAAETAHAADDHHRKCDRQHFEIEPGINPEEGTADDAADRRQQGAERENQSGNERRVNTDPARHLRVVDGRTDGGPQPRLFHHEPQCEADRRSNTDHENPIYRQVQAAENDAAGQFGGRFDVERIAGPDVECSLLEQKGEADRQQDLS